MAWVLKATAANKTIVAIFPIEQWRFKRSRDPLLSPVLYVGGLLKAFFEIRGSAGENVLKTTDPEEKRHSEVGGINWQWVALGASVERWVC